uniref:Uncharacterized protein n=1 Tax=Anguilla anguilla TaxID=7936 RepID=A0A0E9X115_ANGAN
MMLKLRVVNMLQYHVVCVMSPSAETNTVLWSSTFAYLPSLMLTTHKLTCCLRHK